MSNILRILLIILVVNFVALSQTEITQVKIFNNTTNAGLEKAVNDFLEQIWYYEVVSIEYDVITKWTGRWRGKTYFLAMIVYKKPLERHQ